jgi:hypothetical protein
MSLALLRKLRDSAKDCKSGWSFIDEVDIVAKAEQRLLVAAESRCSDRIREATRTRFVVNMVEATGRKNE